MKNKKMLILIAPFLLFFIMIFMLLIVSTSAAAGGMGSAGSSDTISKEMDGLPFYAKCLKAKDEFDIEPYKIFWIFIIAEDSDPSEEYINEIAKWIKDNKPSDKEMVQYIKSKNEYKDVLSDYSDDELIEMIHTCKEIQDGKTESGGATGSIDIKADVESAPYQSANPYTQSGLRGQCTWYAWGRAYETSCKSMPTGNAQNWYASTTLPKGKKPAPGAVVVLAGGAYGHVAFIEKYENGMITYSEGNYLNPHRNDSLMVSYAQSHYKELLHQDTVKDSEFKQVYLSMGLSIVGYIYTN